MSDIIDSSRRQCRIYSGRTHGGDRVALMRCGKVTFPISQRQHRRLCPLLSRRRKTKNDYDRCDARGCPKGASRECSCARNACARVCVQNFIVPTAEEREARGSVILSNWFREFSVRRLSRK